jgi:cell division protein FtsW
MEIIKSINDEKKIIFLMLFLILLGFVYSLAAGSMQALRVNKLEFYFLIKQFSAAFIGTGLIVIAYKIPLDYYRVLVLPLYIVTVMLLVLVFMFDPINGSHRWINLPIFSLQPSELAKFTSILYLAHYLDKKNDEIKELLTGFLPACILLGIVVLLVLLEPDMGGAFLIAVVAFSLFFIAGANVKHLLGIVFFSLPFLVFVMMMGYRKERLISFLDPWSYHNTSGYQLIQSLISVGSGGIFGKGIGNSTQKLYFLPEIHTDFVFAAIAEELGFIGALILIITILLLFILCIKSALKQKDNFKFLLIFGISLMIILPALIHIAVVLGLVPTKGITFPLVSYGGSSLIINMFFIGIILRNIKELKCE